MRRIVAIFSVSVLLAGLLALLTGLSPAQAGDGDLGSPEIDTSVYDANFNPLAGATVKVYDATSHAVVATKTTDANGLANFTTLADGTYLVGATATGYVAQFYSGAADLNSATPLTVDSATSTGSSADLYLDPVPQIQGTLNGPSGPLSFSGNVIVYQFNAGFGDWEYVTSTSTDDVGHYTIAGLAPGTYRLGFTSSGLMDQYWNNQPTVDTATDVVITSGGAVITCNATLSQGGTITGTISGPSGLLTDGNANATLYQKDSSSNWNTVTSAYTDGTGTYTATGLSPGQYKVEFDSDPLQTEFWNDRTDLNSADIITIAGTESHTANAVLSTGATISGKLTSANGGAGISGATVTAYLYDSVNQYWNDVAYAVTDASGNYSLTGLAAGTYHLAFSANGFVDSYYNNKTSIETGDGVTVVRDGSATANAAMVPLVNISGKVTGTGAVGLSGADVTAYDSNGDFVGSATSAADGTYTIQVPPNASYRLRFQATDYIDRYYHDATTLASATAVPVTTTAVTNINQQLPQGGKLVGTITKTGGTALASASVTLYQVLPNGDTNWMDQVSTDPTGAYSFTGLDTGNYLVEASATGWLTEYYNDAYDEPSATPIPVTLSATTTRNIELGVPRHITGTVLSDNGPAIANADVTAQRKVTGPQGTYWEYYDDVLTTASGTYDVPVAPGTYRLRFDASGFRREYSGDTIYPGRAARVVITSSTDGTSNVTLAALGKITGSVKDSSNAAISGATVRVYYYDGSGWYQYSSTSTDATGAYAVAGLQPGHYRLRFNKSGFTRAWYLNANSVETATDVNAALDTVTSGVNQNLTTPALHLSGTVTNASTNAVNGAEVRIDQLVNGVWDTWAYDLSTDASGHYDTEVDPGTYRIRFMAAGLAPEWYDNQFDIANASPVPVTNASVVANAQLAPGGIVQGTVTGPSGAVQYADVVLLQGDPADPTHAVENDHATTDAAGHYSIDSVDPGASYYVQIDADGLQSFTSAKFAVTAGGTVTQNATMVAAPPGPSLSGTVTAGASTPLQYAAVDVYQQYTYGTFTSWYYYDTVYSGADGTWTMPVTGNNTYRVRFTANNYAMQFWNGTYAAGLATPVSVTTSAVTGLNAHMTAGGSVTGQITRAGTSTGLTDATATLYGPDGSGGWAETNQTYVDNTGVYSFPHVGAGTYRIGFSAYGYQGAFWDGSAAGSPTLGTAATFTVTEGAVTTKSQALTKSAVLSGTVTGANGQPADGATVYVEMKLSDGTFDYAGAADVDPDGHWGISLDPGVYRLQFVDDANRVAEWWNNAFTQAGATLVTVGTTDLALGNAQLGDGATITGSVSFPAHPEGWEATVDVYTTAGVWAGSTYVNTTTYGYQVNGLAAGNYRVRFAEGDNKDAEAQWWNNVFEGSGAASATTVALAAGGTQNGVNATLVVGGTMTGKVTNTSNAGVPGCYVSLFSSDTSLSTRSADAVSAADGSFTVRGLTTGNYLILANCPDHAYYYDGSGAMTTTRSGAVTFHTTRGTNTAAPALIVGGDPLLTNTAKPVISGTPKVGSTLTTSNGTWNPVPTSFTYQWSAGGTPIPGAVTSSYVPVAGDLGKTITVTVTASHTGNTDTPVTSDPTAAVGQGTLSNISPPSISGTPKVGQQLSASQGSWSAVPDSVAFQWNADGAPISGATTSTYTPVDGDIGKTITVTATATKAAYTSANATSAATSPVVSASTQVVANTAKPAITGNPVVGQTLTASAGSWNPTPDSVSYQWLAAGTPVSGATQSTYVVQPGDVGKAITVKVTATKATYVDGSATSDPTAAVTQPANQPVTNTAKPTITGTAKVGQTLTAHTGTWNPSTVTTTIQWLRAGAPIAGATGATYKPGALDVGKTLSIRVTASAPAHTPATVTSAATAAVAAGTQACTAKISGTAKVGKTLKAVTACTPAGATMKYQWYRGTKAIAKATKASYKLTTKDKLKKISVKVTFVHAGYTTLVVKSKAVTVK